MTEQITGGTTMGASRDTEIQFNLADAFEAVAAAVPDRTAIIFGDQQLTYAELDAEANKLAHFFADLGVDKGDHVALYLMNSMEHLISIVSLIKIGAPAVNVNYRYTGPELRHIMHDSDSKVIVVELPEHQDLLATLVDQLPELKALLIFGRSDEVGAQGCRPGCGRHRAQLQSVLPVRRPKRLR
ncbi:MAG: AMP-binding protein [Marmoricola sp.]